MIRRPPRSTRKESSAASDVYKRQLYRYCIDTVSILHRYSINIACEKPKTGCFSVQKTEAQVTLGPGPGQGLGQAKAKARAWAWARPRPRPGPGPGQKILVIKTKKYKTFKCFSRFLESKKYTTATFFGFFPDVFLRLFPEFFYEKMGWNTESRVRRRFRKSRVRRRFRKSRVRRPRPGSLE